MTPCSLPTFLNVSITRSSCERVWVAIREVRMRQAFGGTAGASTISCGDLGYEGRCYGETLVWAQDGQCRVAHCAELGKTCGDDGPNGYNCI